MNQFAPALRSSRFGLALALSTLTALVVAGPIAYQAVNARSQQVALDGSIPTQPSPLPEAADTTAETASVFMPTTTAAPVTTMAEPTQPAGPSVDASASSGAAPTQPAPTAAAPTTSEAPPVESSAPTTPPTTQPEPTTSLAPSSTTPTTSAPSTTIAAGTTPSTGPGPAPPTALPSTTAAADVVEPEGPSATDTAVTSTTIGITPASNLPETTTSTTEAHPTTTEAGGCPVPVESDVETTNTTEPCESTTTAPSSDDTSEPSADKPSTAGVVVDSVLLDPTAGDQIESDPANEGAQVAEDVDAPATTPTEGTELLAQGLPTPPAAGDEQSDPVGNPPDLDPAIEPEDVAVTSP